MGGLDFLAAVATDSEDSATGLEVTLCSNTSAEGVWEAELLRSLNRCQIEAAGSVTQQRRRLRHTLRRRRKSHAHFSRHPERSPRALPSTTPSEACWFWRHEWQE